MTAAEEKSFGADGITCSHGDATKAASGVPEACKTDGCSERGADDNIEPA
jgi:hypothetical protein